MARPVVRDDVGVMRGVVDSGGVGSSGGRRFADVSSAVVDCTRMQRGRSVFDDEGPSRKQRGDRATTRAPKHSQCVTRLPNLKRQRRPLGLVGHAIARDRDHVYELDVPVT